MGQNRLSQGSKRWQLQHDGAYPMFKHAHMGMDMYGLKCGISWISIQEWGKTCAPLGLKSSLIPRKALYRLNSDATFHKQLVNDGAWYAKQAPLSFLRRTSLFQMLQGTVPWRVGRIGPRHSLQFKHWGRCMERPSVPWLEVWSGAAADMEPGTAEDVCTNEATKVNVVGILGKSKLKIRNWERPHGK